MEIPVKPTATTTINPRKEKPFFPQKWSQYLFQRKKHKNKKSLQLEIESLFVKYYSKNYYY